MENIARAYPLPVTEYEQGQTYDAAMTDLYRERLPEAFAMFRALLLDGDRPGE
ncbi:MAG: hypothetical protein CBARDCOR_6903 [uncultured Caballeronia sp.]|nr:MAG: hypothetical protein CBARDCOR_6903 [uncultured Caballeronia sp.]